MANRRYFAPAANLYRLDGERAALCEPCADEADESQMHEIELARRGASGRTCEGLPTENPDEPGERECWAVEPVEDAEALAVGNMQGVRRVLAVGEVDPALCLLLEEVNRKARDEMRSELPGLDDE